MDLESPLRSIGSPVESEVLRVVARSGAVLTAPQIARLLPVASQFGIRKALLRLEQIGLVASEQYGNTRTYSANRDHVLWPAVLSATDARNELFDRLRAFVQQLPDLQVFAYLYGSVARRESTPESDVDILLVFPEETEHGEIADIAYELSGLVERWTGNRAHINNVDATYLREAASAGDPLIESLRSDAFTISGPPFRDLLSTNGDGNHGEQK
jgi:predicted nucleotidyltransferase